MKIKSGFIKRTVGTEHVVLSVDGKFNGMIKLNAVGADLWDFFCTEHTAAQAVEYLCQKYEVDAERAAKNVDMFMQQVEKNGLSE